MPLQQTATEGMPRSSLQPACYAITNRKRSSGSRYTSCAREKPRDANHNDHLLRSVDTDILRNIIRWQSRQSTGFRRSPSRCYPDASRRDDSAGGDQAREYETDRIGAYAAVRCGSPQSSASRNSVPQYSTIARRATIRAQRVFSSLAHYTSKPLTSCFNPPNTDKRIQLPHRMAGSAGPWNKALSSRSTPLGLVP